MIYILSGNDTKKKSARVKSLTSSVESIFIQSKDLSEEILDNYSSSASLFGKSYAVIAENVLDDSDAVTLSVELLTRLQSSQTIFIFLEDKITTVLEKKYKKFASIEKFERKEIKQPPKINVFAIADAFGHRDKIKAWTLYREAVDSGVEPEAISGMLFWKIKTMILGKQPDKQKRVNDPILDNLKRQSGELVSLYHKAHRGEIDFIIGLEQFILSSLSN